MNMRLRATWLALIVAALMVGSHASAEEFAGPKDKLEDLGHGLDGVSPLLGDMLKDEMDAIRQAKADADFANKVREMSGQKADKGTLADAFKQEAQQLYDQYQQKYGPLDDQDRQYEPQQNPPGSPGVPTHCDGNDTCGSCYANAQEKLDRSRMALEKLRAVWAYTKHMHDDGVSSLNAMGEAGGSIAALEAHAQVRHADEALAGVAVAYDKKYDELIGGLKASLDGIAQCEKQYFANDDWYDRYGFIYYQFMSTRYQR